MNAVVQLTGSVGRLEGAINSLSDQIGQLRDDQIVTAARLEKVERTIIVAASIIALVVAAGGFVANKAIDFGLDMAKAKMIEQPVEQTRASQPALNQAVPTTK